jgi:ribosomal-protein-alanine N-acetyltransferase
MNVLQPKDRPPLWLENEHWWLYEVHPFFSEAFARFHARNRHHLRMAMTLTPEIDLPSYWEGELPRRRTAMQAGQVVHLVGFVKQGDSSEIGCLLSFWAIEHGDFRACTISFMLDEPLEARSLMYSAAAPAVSEVLRRHNLHRIMATHLPENLRSAALLRRLGFVVEGYARDFVMVNGKWRDNVLLSLLVDERRKGAPVVNLVAGARSDGAAETVSAP